MADVQHNAQLNQVLIDLGRSALQYAIETQARCGSDADLMANLVHRQQHDAALIGQLLNIRGWSIDYGSYPTNYGGSHYLNLSFWLPFISNGQQALLTELSETIHACADDLPAKDVLHAVLESEQEIMKLLPAQKPAAVTSA